MGNKACNNCFEEERELELTTDVKSSNVRSETDTLTMDKVQFKENFSFKNQMPGSNRKDDFFITPIKKDSLLDLNQTEHLEKYGLKSPNLEAVRFAGISTEERFKIKDPIQRIRFVYNYWYGVIDSIRNSKNPQYLDKPNNRLLNFVEDFSTILNDTPILYTGLLDDRSCKQGFGVIQWNDKSKYEGEWVDDRATGVGRLKHVAGDEYNGEWLNDKAHGYGTYFHAADNSHYVGYWVLDKQTGEGVEVFHDGSKYSGTYVNGLKHGKGEFKWADGSAYLGEFAENNIHGHGKYYWVDGRVYEGSWEHNRINGYGVFSWPDGRVYEGNYKDDKKHGHGKFFWKDGKKYIGNWEDGKQHGDGVMYKDGTQVKGTWVRGKLLNESDKEVLKSKQIRLQEIFNEYDKRHQGYITKDNFLHLTISNQFVHNQNDALDIITRFDLGDTIYFNQFCEIFE